jgi:hypothetical protein
MVIRRAFLSYSKALHLAWTHTTRRLNLDCSEYDAVITACALALRDLTLGTQLLKDHLCMSTLVRIGMVETHHEVVLGLILVTNVKSDRLSR